MDKKTGGLAGIVAGETAICTVGKEGVGLTYRGYSIEDLAEKSTFEEVAYLLIKGKLPKENELASYRKELQLGQNLPIDICRILETFPKSANPMDVLRSACSALGIFEPESKDNIAEKIASRLMPFCVSALLYWYQNKQARDIDNAHPINPVSGEHTLAKHFLHLLYVLVYRLLQ